MGNNRTEFIFKLDMIRYVIEYKKGAFVAEWLVLLTKKCLPLTTVGLNPTRDFGFFHVMKLSS